LRWYGVNSKKGLQKKTVTGDIRTTRKSASWKRKRDVPEGEFNKWKISKGRKKLLKRKLREQPRNPRRKGHKGKGPHHRKEWAGVKKGGDLRKREGKS